MTNINFENNWRRKQELRMRPIANKLYRQIFGDKIDIERFEKEDEWMLDKFFAIDVRLTFPNGMILIGQEKFLSYKYSSFATVTVEQLQDQDNQNSQGDWFKLGVQFYFVGYTTKDETGFFPWVILNWPSTVIATINNKIKWYSNNNQDGKARASFTYCYMNQIPQECLIANQLVQPIQINII